MGGEDDRIGEYRVVGRLGAGGMGEVFLVKHPRLPRREALKLLDPSVSRNQEFRPRFLREADLLAKLHHPNIVTVFDRGESDGRLWLSMEYVPGMDAGQLLTDRGALPLDQVLQIVGGAGAALDYAYAEHGITHRDVKPANMLLEVAADNRITAVKLADFGIAKAAGESTSLTSAGITIGTMAYISPEAIEGLDLDNRADVYSLACSAFQLLTGTTPFTATSVAALVAAHLTQDAPSIADRNPRLPRELDAVFERALAKEPHLRHATCEEFVAELTEGRDTGTTTGVRTRPWTPSEPRPDPHAGPTLAARRTAGGLRRGIVIAAVCAVVGASVAAVGFWWRDGRSDAAEKAGRIAETLAVPGDPRRVAVDTAGNLYVTESLNNSVFKYSAGQSIPQALPFTGLSDVRGVAVSAAGDVYLADADNDRIVKLPARSSTPEILPIKDVDFPIGLAVDRADNLYISTLTGKVAKVAAGSDVAQPLPFAGLSQPYEVAVDDAGNVYVADAGNNRIVELPAGAADQRVLPFADLDYPTAVAVDANRTVYAGSGNGVERLTADSSAPENISVPNLSEVEGLAVDSAGQLYAAETSSHQVVKIVVG